MPQGLQIFNAAGAAVLDISDLAGRVLGTATLAPGVNASLTHPAFSNGTPVWQLYSLNANANVVQPRVTWTESGGVKRIEWTWPSASTTGTACLLIYGVS